MSSGAGSSKTLAGYHLVLTAVIAFAGVRAYQAANKTAENAEKQADVAKQQLDLGKKADDRATLLKGLAKKADTRADLLKGLAEREDKRADRLERIENRQDKRAIALAELTHSEQIREDLKELRSLLATAGKSYCPGAPSYVLKPQVDSAVRLVEQLDDNVSTTDLVYLVTFGDVFWGFEKSHGFCSEAIRVGRDSFDRYYAHIVLGFIHFKYADKDPMASIKNGRDAFEKATSALILDENSAAYNFYIGWGYALWAKYEKQAGNNSASQEKRSEALSYWATVAFSESLKEQLDKDLKIAPLSEMRAPCLLFFLKSSHPSEKPTPDAGTSPITPLADRVTDIESRLARIESDIGSDGSPLPNQIGALRVVYGSIEFDNQTPVDQFVEINGNAPMRVPTGRSRVDGIVAGTVVMQLVGSAEVKVFAPHKWRKSSGELVLNAVVNYP